MKSFTLVEVMIVIGLILLLATLAIPNVLRARITANETVAITSLKSIFTSAQIYKNNNSVYPATLGDLANSNPPYLEEELACSNQPCFKQGYNFSLRGFRYSFSATAYPQSFGHTGRRSFYIDESGVLKYCDTLNCDPSQGTILQE